MDIGKNCVRVKRDQSDISNQKYLDYYGQDSLIIKFVNIIHSRDAIASKNVIGR